jgi:serine protease SohB
MELCDGAEVYEIKYVEKKPLQERLGLSVETTVERVFRRWFDRDSMF